jgi:hypothetical protein
MSEPINSASSTQAPAFKSETSGSSHDEETVSLTLICTVIGLTAGQRNCLARWIDLLMHWCTQLARGDHGKTHGVGRQSSPRFLLDLYYRGGIGQAPGQFGGLPGSLADVVVLSEGFFPGLTD